MGDVNSIFKNNEIKSHFKQNQIKKYIYSNNTNINEVPYISTYYMQPKIFEGEELTIELYATDWNQSEYLNDIRHEFELLYKIDEELYTKKISSGDNSISIKNLSEGEHIISLQLKDKQNRLSHTLYHEVLVINKNYIPNIYEVTDDDLVRFSINKNNSALAEDLSNTHAGLNSLFATKSNEGYDGVLLPTGIYRIKQIGYPDSEESIGRHDNTHSIKIPSNFTVDLNGSTIKQHVYEGHASLMVSFYNAFDSHLINGTLEGDYLEHITTDTDGKANTNGEHCYCIDFQGNCKYCTLDNLVIKNTTGYTTISQSLHLGTATGDKTLTKGDIINGELVPSEYRKSTINFLDISPIKTKSNYLRASIYLGLSGMVGNSWILDFHFYDENYTFLESIRGFQYRKVLIPNDARYLKLTMHDSELENIDNLTVYDYGKPVNCSIMNVKYENTRTCGIATAQTDNLLVKNVEFINSGQHITPLPVDLEDGWYGTLDTTFDNISMKDCLFHSVLVCSGHNTIFENCNGEDMSFTFRGGWNGSRGGVVRNCNIGHVSVNHGVHACGAFLRVYNNTLVHGVVPNYYTATYDESFLPLVLRDNIINSFELSTDCNMVFDNCTFIGREKLGLKASVPGSVEIRNSVLRDYNDSSQEIYWRNLTIRKSEIENVYGRIQNELSIEECIVRNFDMLIYSGNSNDVELKNNTLYDSTINSIYYLPTLANVIFEGNIIINETSHLVGVHVVSLSNVLLKNNNITCKVSPLYIDGYGYGSNVVNVNIEVNNNVLQVDAPYVIDGKTSYINMKDEDIVNISEENNTYVSEVSEFINPLLEQNQYIHVE